MAGRDLFAAQPVAPTQPVGRNLFAQQPQRDVVAELMMLDPASRGRAISGESPESKAALLAEIDRREREQQMVQLASEQSALGAGAIAAGRGMTTIGRGLGLAEQATPTEQQAFGALEEARPVATTIGEVAGQAAPFLLAAPLIPAAATAGGTAAGVGAAAGLGALEGGLITRGEGGDIADQLTGAGIGGAVAGTAELVLPRIVSAGSKIVRRVLGRAPKGAVVDATGKPSEELIEALDKVGISFDDLAAQERLALAGAAVDPEQAARKAFLESQGLDPTRAQVTRGAADFQAQQEAAKTSNLVREAIEKQEAVLTTRFNNAIVESGGEAVTPTSTVTDAIVNKATALDTEISGLYKQAREAAKGDAVVGFDVLASRLKGAMAQDRATGGAVKAIIGDLQNKGVIDNEMKVIGRATVEMAEDARKVMNQLYDPQQPFRNIKLRELKEALDNDVFRAAGDDVFSQARKAKAKFESDLARAKISKFDSRRQNLVRDVLENRVDPDALVDKVVFGKSYRAEDIKQLKDYIGTDEAGKAAFNDLRAETLQKIRDKAFFGPVDEAGNQALSRDKLGKALASIGQSKMNVLFTPQENKFLKNMMEVAKLREPVRGTALGEGPSAQAVNKLRAEIKKGSLIAGLLESITFDKKGRAVLNSSPAKRIIDVTPKPNQTRSALSQAAAISAVPQQEQQ